MLTITSQLKLPQPSRHTSNTSNASASSFARSAGPNRHNQFERSQPQRNGRPGHARSKSQYARPQTAHAHRHEEPDEDNDTSNGTAMLPPSKPLDPLPSRKLRHQTSTTSLAPKNTRDSSLTTRMSQLTINDHGARRSQAISRTSSIASLRSSASSEIPQPTNTNITIRRPDKCNKENVNPAASQPVMSQA